jgi:thioredoxin-like negative regulator of GroEL
MIRPFWLLVAGMVLLYIFAVIALPANRRRHATGLIPRSPQGILPGETRHMLYENFADSAQPVFYMFGVSWCPHCISTKPEFEALTSIPTISERVQIRYVDAEAEKAATQGFDIQGYPTFYLVQGSQKIKYSGPREQAAFVDFLQKQIGA